MWLCLKMCSENMVLVRLLQIGAKDLTVLSSALGVLYLRLLGNPGEFLPSFHLEWTLECTNYKINPHIFIKPKYGKFVMNNIVFVG